MGNSASHPSKSSDNATKVPISSPISRRGMTGRTSNSVNAGGLAPPSSASHRRSRSANAAAPSRMPFPEPPPPYSPPIPTKFPTVTEVDAQNPAGSLHTSIFMAARSSRGSSNRTGRTNTYLRTPMRQQSREDALETLKKYDTVIIVDDSASMQGALWREATEALAALAELAGNYDTDGIDIHFLNSAKVASNMRSAQKVQELFKSVDPRGITPIAEKLENLLRPYLSKLEHAYDTNNDTLLKGIKPVNYIIITDGAPTDDPEPVIVQAARRLDAKYFPITQLGIQFVQIGNSRRATEYLNKLDNDLMEKHKIRDIVDTTPYFGQLNADNLVKILLGGINKRVDVRGAGAVM